MLLLFQNMPVLWQALAAAAFTYGLTALGACMVFFFKRIDRLVLNIMLGSASGIMIAASFWSLLNPAIKMAEASSVPSWVVAAGGFLCGGGCLLLIDKIIPHLHIGKQRSEAEGPPSRLKTSALLVIAVTLHNIPEGLALGVSFGAAAIDGSGVSLAAALALAAGIGIQNFPEGAAVSIPLRKDGMSRLRSFGYGQASGLVEPLGALAGAAAVTAVRSILPFALAFAAGAMVFVVVEELLPEAQKGGNKDVDVSTLGFLFGFALMMVLDVALGH